MSRGLVNTPFSWVQGMEGTSVCMHTLMWTHIYNQMKIWGVKCIEGVRVTRFVVQTLQRRCPIYMIVVRLGKEQPGIQHLNAQQHHSKSLTKYREVQHTRLTVPATSSNQQLVPTNSPPLSFLLIQMGQPCECKCIALASKLS